MISRMKSAATTAGFTGTGAMKNYYAAHVAHLKNYHAARAAFLNNMLVAGDGRFTYPACTTNKTYSTKSKVVEHMKNIAAKHDCI
jgi:hypothetical protein